MQLGKKGDAPQDKQKLMTIGLIAVIVLAGGYFVYSNFLAGSGDTAMPPGDVGQVAPPPPGAPGMMPGAPAPPGPGGPMPGAPPPAPSAPPAAAPAPAATPAPAAPAKPAPPKGATRSITVFGSVTVAYPSGWGIAMGSAGSAAVLSDGKGRFEIHAPDPKAATAQAIAASTLKSVAKGRKVVSQGAVKIAGHDAYQYTVSGPAGPTRIVGIDAPTRISVVEYVKGGSLAAYKAKFDQMESGLQFR